MRAMILAAGKGERMRPLTNNMPKPLLKVKGKALIVYQIEALVLAGVKELIINTGIMGEKIQNYLGNGQSYGVHIEYSPEEEPQETAGGIIKALPLLGDSPFITTNSDILTDFDYKELIQKKNQLAYLVLVSNPSHNLSGDFSLQGDYVLNNDENNLTYSGIALYSPLVFKELANGYRPLKPILNKLASMKKLTGKKHQGKWMDIGTPERLKNVNN